MHRKQGKLGVWPFANSSRSHTDTNGFETLYQTWHLFGGENDKDLPPGS